MKAKKIAKRLRARAHELRQLHEKFQGADPAPPTRARLLADVLEEVADQVSPQTAISKMSQEPSPSLSKASSEPYLVCYSKIYDFLKVAWERIESRQLIQVDLLGVLGNGAKDELIRTWVRADWPEFFVDTANIKKLVLQMLELAEGAVAAKPIGKQRFVVRAHQPTGMCERMSFALSSADDLVIKR